MKWYWPRTHNQWSRLWRALMRVFYGPDYSRWPVWADGLGYRLSKALSWRDWRRMKQAMREGDAWLQGRK